MSDWGSGFEIGVVRGEWIYKVHLDRSYALTQAFCFQVIKHTSVHRFRSRNHSKARVSL
jgi:hypothetical protein